MLLDDPFAAIRPQSISANSHEFVTGTTGNISDMLYLMSFFDSLHAPSPQGLSATPRDHLSYPDVNHPWLPTLTSQLSSVPPIHSQVSSNLQQVPPDSRYVSNQHEWFADVGVSHHSTDHSMYQDLYHPNNFPMASVKNSGSYPAHNTDNTSHYQHHILHQPYVGRLNSSSTTLSHEAIPYAPRSNHNHIHAPTSVGHPSTTSSYSYDTLTSTSRNPGLPPVPVASHLPSNSSVPASSFGQSLDLDAMLGTDSQDQEANSRWLESILKEFE